MLLLDSQVVLWVADGSPRLGEKARNKIESAQGTYFSSATLWELTIKAMLGRLTLPPQFGESLIAQGMQELPVTSAHAEAIRHFPELAKHDPFDRLLVAQAATAGLTLVTADRVLLGLGRRFIVDATA